MNSKVNLLLLALVLAPVAMGQPGAGRVAVYLDGIEGTDGDVVVRLFRSADGFPADRRRAYRELRRAVTGTTATVLFDDVPEGAVAVVAFHDRDRDGRVRLDAAGVPLDGVATATPAGDGAANWDAGTAPAFRQSALRVGRGVTVARLRFWYPR